MEPDRRPGGVLRLVGIGVLCAVVLTPHAFQCAQAPFTDESIILSNVYEFFADRTILPRYTWYPTLHAYCVAPAIAVNTVGLWASGQLRSPGEIGMLEYVDPLAVLWPARVVSLLCLVASAAVVGGLAARTWSVPSGTAAAGFLLITPMLLNYGAYCLPDMMTMMFTAGALLYAVRLVAPAPEAGSFRNAALGGAFAGLATACKYTGCVAFVPVVLAVVLNGWEARSPRLAARQCAAAIGAAVVCFLLACPGWVLAPGRMLQGVHDVRRFLAEGWLGSEGVPVLGQLELVIRHITGDAISGAVIVAALVLGGVVWARRRGRGVWVSVGLVVATVGLAATATKQGPHYLFPMFPALALFAGSFTHRMQRRLPRTVWMPLICVVAVWPLLDIWQNSAANLRVRTVDIAEKWMYANVPEGSRVAVDWGGVPRLWSRQALRELRDGPRGQAGPRLMALVESTAVVYDTVPVEYSEAFLRSAPADYLVTSSKSYGRFFRYGRFTRIPPPETRPLHDEFTARRRFYEALFTEALWRTVYSVDTGNGPEVFVFARRREGVPSPTTHATAPRVIPSPAD